MSYDCLHNNRWEWQAAYCKTGGISARSSVTVYFCVTANINDQINLSISWSPFITSEWHFLAKVWLAQLNCLRGLSAVFDLKTEGTQTDLGFTRISLVSFTETVRRKEKQIEFVLKGWSDVEPAHLIVGEGLDRNVIIRYFFLLFAHWRAKRPLLLGHNEHKPRIRPATVFCFIRILFAGFRLY